MPRRGTEAAPAFPMTLSTYLALALTSGSVIALQVIFTRVFSITIWYHFTYLVIGVALLGGGGAGTFLALRAWTPRELAGHLRATTLALSLSVLATTAVVLGSEIDPLRRAALAPSLIGLTLCFVGLFATFFLAGLVVASVFSVWHRAAHRLYFADMAGAGTSALLTIWMVQVVGGPAALVLVALATVLAGLLVGGADARPRSAVMAGVAAAEAALLALVVATQPVHLPVPVSNELGWAQRQYGFRPELTRWNPVGRVDVLPEIRVKEPMIVGGISAAYRGSEAFARLPDFPLRIVTLDGTSMTGLYRFDGSSVDLRRFAFLDHSVISAPYHLGLPAPSTLNIGVGGGLDLLLSRYYGARDVTAIELNPDVVDLLQATYADYSGRLSREPHTRLIAAEGRSFLSRTSGRYDIIQGIGLDNLAALSGGAYVLTESYLYTVEALELALGRLTPSGVFSWTRNADRPPREMLRLVALAAESLTRLGAENPAAHIAMVANDTGSQATLVVGRRPLTDEAMRTLREWAAANHFPLVHDPHARLETVYAEYLHTADRRDFERDYPFNIHPVTDDNPFFYNYFRWTNWTWNRSFTGDVQRLPMANLILLVMFACSLVAALGSIVLPLVRRRHLVVGGVPSRAVVVYFSALGMGYVFVQIVLIQRFTLFIGYPTSAITTTISSILVFSAVGGLVAQRLLVSAPRAVMATSTVAAALLIYAVGLPPLFEWLHSLPDSNRVVLSVLIIAPLAMVMGMPFPTGLRQVGAAAPDLVAWAWGMNGVFSVLGSTMVILVGMSTSFTVAMLCGVVFYALAAAATSSMWHVSRRPQRHPEFQTARASVTRSEARVECKPPSQSAELTPRKAVPSPSRVVRTA